MTKKLRAGVIGAVAILAGILMIGAETLGPRDSWAADALPAPTGPVILTIDGNIGVHNTADGKAEFDLAMLQALPLSALETTTIWTDGMQSFEGVRVADLLARVGSSASEIKARASNDYEFRFPVSHPVDAGAIIAYRVNGEELPLSNKGPLWIVYNYDNASEVEGEQFRNESVWNLETLTLY